MDAIFYGKSVDVKAPAYALLGSIVDVELFVRGSTGVISYAELWQNDELIGTYTKDDFELGQLTVKS